MPFATISWEISTSDPVRYASIAQAVQKALGNFGPSPLLATTVVLETESQNVESVRRALDSVASSFPQEFFYTSSNHGSADVQGVYPPWGDLAGAWVATGSSRNPRARTATALAAGRTGQRRTDIVGSRRRARRVRARKSRLSPRTMLGEASPKAGRKAAPKRPGDSRRTKRSTP